MGKLNMSVRNASGLSTRIPAPTVASILPISGAAAGGTPVVITGTHFKPGATATIGGVAITAPVVTSRTTLAGVTGAHVAAAGLDVVVTNHDGGPQSGTGAGLFEYT